MQYELSEIWRYPVKSLRGMRHQSLPVVETGFLYDRHWMLVDESGRFLSQRVLPRMALIQAVVEQEQLRLSAPGRENLYLPLMESEGAEAGVDIWRDRCTARLVSPEADYWLSDFLGELCRLVYLPGDEIRAVDPDYAQASDRVGFADGFPFMLISQASLDDLNNRMPEKVTMERFRPNLVISGCAPYEEDHWKRIRVGEIDFRIAKPCARCGVPTIDPETGEKAGEEPIKTLLAYRKRGNQVFFGQNLAHDEAGLLEIGMKVDVLEASEVP